MPWAIRKRRGALEKKLCPYCGVRKVVKKSNARTCGKMDCQGEHHKRAVMEYNKKYKLVVV
jgi:hypothetical protein